MKSIDVNLAAAVGSSLAAASSVVPQKTAIILPPLTSASAVLQQPAFDGIMLIPRGGAQEDDTNKDGKLPKKSNHHKKKRSSSHKNDDSTSSSSTASESNNHTPNNSDNSSPIVQEILDKGDDYYAILGIPREATSTDITKAYRRRAVQTHPDKTGGDRRAFDKVAQAYDCLGDDEKRNLYDRFGIQGASADSGADYFSPSNIFDMFQQQAQQQQQRFYRQNRTIRYQLQVSLEDLYTGMAKDVTVQAPTGRQQTKDVQVQIQPGSVSGQAIRLSGEMDFSSEEVPGDIIFVLTQLPHPIFARKGHDLACELEISLEEAVCGLTRGIPHLDGTTIWISSSASKVLHNGDVQVLKSRGMPKKHAPGEYGDLYIQYKVELPKATSKKGSLTESERKELGRLLRKLEGKKSSKHTKSQPPPPDATVHTLETADPADFGKASGSIVLDEEDDLDADRHYGSGMFGGGNTRRFYFGGSTFGGAGPYQGDDDGSNVQCQQM